MPDHASTTPNLPRPTVTLLPARSALPREGGVIDALLRVEVEFPDADRPPFAVALVIDRSGSMSGSPLEAAKRAAESAVGMLMPEDWVAVVAFDDRVETPVPLTRAGSDRGAILAAIRTIHSRGSTALHAGWVEGVTQVLAGGESVGVKRVVLLSDGNANVGVTDRASIARDVAEATQHGVTTSALGFALHYDELLLRAIADAGQGNYVFIEDASQLTDVFTRELASLGALRGRKVRLRSNDAGAKVRHAAAGLTEGEHGLVLPDLVAGLPLELLVRVEVAPGTASLDLTFAWDDVLLGEPCEERVQLELPSVGAGEFARLPVDGAVVVARTLLDVAEAKEAISHAARNQDSVRARERLVVLQGLVATLPEGAERQREEAELSRLQRSIEARDYAHASRFAEKQSSEWKRSRKDFVMNDMILAEEKHRSARLAARKGVDVESLGAQSDLFGAAAGGYPGARTPGAHSPGASSPGLVVETTVTQRSGRPLRVEVVLGDITEQRVDAIVNSTNRGLFGTEGVDGAIHRGGGPELTEAARGIGSLAYGGAVFTPGFALPARYVIHTATPPWKGVGKELATLGLCHRSSLALATKIGARTIAFPAIGTGAYGYPLAEAAHAAVGAVLSWSRDHGDLDAVRFVLFDEASAEAYVRELRGVTA